MNALNAMCKHNPKARRGVSCVMDRNAAVMSFEYNKSLKKSQSESNDQSLFSFFLIQTLGLLYR